MSVSRDTMASVYDVPVEKVKCETCTEYDPLDDSCSFWHDGEVIEDPKDEFCSFWELKKK